MEVLNEVLSFTKVGEHGRLMVGSTDEGKSLLLPFVE